ncbi:integrase core domain-containing protein [Bowmanella yangjiangensis]|uniref:integrase core domain-containing protein n=1 Tax=Bowmanella yangjiangensis TaxID=2811230 RepID=UPI0038CC0B0B
MVASLGIEGFIAVPQGFAHWFESLPDAKLKIEAWRDDYNKSRPHRALNNLPPSLFVASIEN